MLQIRQEQIQELEEIAVHRANLELADYAMRRFPSKFKEQEEEKILCLARQVRDKANKYGIINQNDMASALDFTIMYGLDFYEADWAKDIFQDPDMPVIEKMKTLRHRVQAQVPGY